VGVIGGVVIGGVVLGGILGFTGDPSACKEGESTPSPGAVASLFDKWNQFETQALAGPATVQFDETEATSRAQQYLDEEGIPLDDAQVYFCPDGVGQVKGKVNALGRDINVLLEGTVDTSGPEPVIQVEDIDIGNWPPFLENLLKDVITDRLDDNDARTLDFGVPISAVNFSDGAVTMESPGP
jgi:hypothetical protein